MTRVPSPRLRLWGSRIALVLGALLVTTTIVELGLTFWPLNWTAKASANSNDIFARVDAEWNVPHPDLGFVRKPFVSFHGRLFEDPRAHDVAYTTDAHGFRNSPDLKRSDLVFIGDSFVEAGNVPQESTFVQRCSEALGVPGANLGRGFYGPQQELIVLKRFAEAYQPKVVVWCVFEGNDLQDAVRYQEFREEQARQPSWSESLSTWLKQRQISQLWKAARRKLKARKKNYQYTWELVGQFQPKDHPPEDVEFCYRYRPDAPTRYASGMAALVDSLEEAAKWCEKRSVEFLVVFLPTKLRVMGPFTQFSDSSAFARYTEDGRFDHPQNLAERLALAMIDREIRFLDMTGPLRDATKDGALTYSARYDNHLDLAGHAVVAERMEEVIRGLFLPR